MYVYSKEIDSYCFDGDLEKYLLEKGVSSEHIEKMKNDILDEISETRIYCGFREKMIQVANRPCDVVAMEWPIC